MPNGINDLSPNIRDFLLLKNLILADSIEENGLSYLAKGLGRPVAIGDLPPIVQPSQDIEFLGQFYRDLSILNNPYISPDGYNSVDITTQNMGNIGNLPPGFNPIDYYHGIGSKIEGSAFNIAAQDGLDQLLKNKYYDESLLEQINIDSTIVASNSVGVYDYKASINAMKIDDLLNAVNLGGVAQTLGNVTDLTPLAVIANEQIVKHFGYNASFGLAQETLGQVNLNPLSLLKGNDILVPNYSITVPQGALGEIVDFGSKVLGFEIPKSLLTASSSIFAKENPVGNIERANSMILNTGRGQVLAMMANLNENKYKPNLSDNRNKLNVIKGEDGTTNVELYAFGTPDGSVQDILNFKGSLSDGALTPDGIPTEAGAAEISEQAFEATFGPISTAAEGNFNQDFPSLDDIQRNDRIQDGFSWGSNVHNPEAITGIDGYNTKFNSNRNSILYKTKLLFHSNKVKTLVSGHGVGGQYNTEIQNVGGNGFQSTGFISKGSGVLSPSALDGTSNDPSEVFCRTWTTFDRYDNVEDLQKNRGLMKFDYRKRTNLSVLDDKSNGFVKIAPYIQDKDKKDYAKKFMFSIENLAWDGESNLRECERGPGDPLTGTRGRIMWFPPYALTFTDTSSVDWDSSKFIGRGEPVYTYNNTERTGTLSFKVITDYSTYMDAIRNDIASTNDKYASIAAGCYDIDAEIASKLTPVEKDVVEVKKATKTQTVNGSASIEIAPPKFTIYFPNDSVSIPDDYENGVEDPNGVTFSDGYTFQGCSGKPGISKGGCPCTQLNPTDYSLNKQKVTLPNAAPITEFDSWNNTGYIEALADYIVKYCPSCRIDISGYASSDGDTVQNQSLSAARADYIKNILRTALEGAGDSLLDKRFSSSKGFGDSTAVSDPSCPAKPKGSGCGNVAGIPPVYEECKKRQRKTIISFESDPNLEPQVNAAVKPTGIPEKEQEVQLNKEIVNRFITECDIFERMEADSPIVFNELKEKIKYFHPAFHSTTAEGFNSRLNFLLQCTRQGPTPNNTDDPNNLAFGKAPVCILRIGDFYNTKIVIDNVDYNFEENGGVVWDLNPEGIGVQPMICNVNVSFKFIGGSSLSGPINKLQNAVSFNFFANTEVYDPRADYYDEGLKTYTKGEQPDYNAEAQLPNTTEGLTNDLNQPVVIQGNRVEGDIASGLVAGDSTDANNACDFTLTTFKVPNSNDLSVILTSTETLNGESFKVELTYSNTGEYIDTKIVEATDSSTTVVFTLDSIVSGILDTNAQFNQTIAVSAFIIGKPNTKKIKKIN